MSDARIDAYDEIHENAQRRSIAEVGKRISGMKDARSVQPGALRVGHLFLQTYEFEVWIEQAPEQLKLYASAPVWYWIPAPDDAHSRLGFPAEPIPPHCHFFFIGRKVARAGYTPDICLERERETQQRTVEIKLWDVRIEIHNMCVGIEAPHQRP
jgi:hypothetical protein